MIRQLTTLISKEERQHLEAVSAWLDENTVIIPEPETVTLLNFKVDWSSWSGSFQIKFDDALHSDRFHFSEDGTGKVRFSLPNFVSPLGAPASYPAVEISRLTRKAINRALIATFPKITPHGRNRETGIETTVQTKICDRVTSGKLTAVKLLVSSDYSVTVGCHIKTTEKKNKS